MERVIYETTGNREQKSVAREEEKCKSPDSKKDNWKDGEADRYKYWVEAAVNDRIIPEGINICRSRMAWREKRIPNNYLQMSISLGMPPKIYEIILEMRLRKELEKNLCQSQGRFGVE